MIIPSFHEKKIKLTDIILQRVIMANVSLKPQ